MKEDPEFQEKVLLLLKNLRRIQAIKEYRLFYKTSLKEARDAVDKLMKENGLWDEYWKDSNEI